MFKLAACFWMALAVPATVYGEVEPSLAPLMAPDQYFAAEFRDDYYWRLLFPDDPPFAYACMYRPSFGREFGFYLDGDTLYWARAVGPCSAQMLSQFPMVKLQNMVEQYIPGLLSCLPFPISGKLMERWNRMSEGRGDDPFSSGGENASDSFSQFWEGCMFAVGWVESTINSTLYSRLFVKRGAIELTPSLAGTLRKTWDEAITGRTFSMDLYRQYLAVCGGEYFYFRGASGPVGEDLCRGKGMMRSAMRDLAYGLIDMAMMNDLKPEGEQWMMEQCALICRYAAALGDEAPPMVSEAWVQDFLERLAKQEERNGDQGKERKMNKSAPEGSTGTEEKTEEKSASSYSKTSYVRGFRKRFLRSLDRNPLWKDLFPAGTQGKPGVCWLGNRGICGFYLDGSLMGRAESESMAHTPLSVYNLWFFERKPEKPVFPYEGIPDGAGHMEPRVRREWLYTGEAVSRLMAGILTDIARGKIIAGEGEKQEDIRFCVVRGIDGTERIMSSSDADLQAVVDLMDSLYTIDLLFNGDEDYLLWIFEKFAVLQGRRKVEKDEAPARKGGT